MGSFDSACAFSNLPIGGGDAVRFILLTEVPTNGRFVCESEGRWAVRTWPIKAYYNDYGTIEFYEEGPFLDAILEGMQVDLVEVGVGDNSFHDVAVRKSSTFEQLLEGVWEGRLRVDSDVDRTRPVERPDEYEDPAYVPSLRNVEKVLVGVELLAGGRFLVDEVGGGARVRWNSLSGHFEDEAYLNRARTLLEEAGFAVALTAGSGNYSHGCELRVFMSPGLTDHPDPQHRHPRSFREPRSREQARLVKSAMIREDVWQALLSHKIQMYAGGKFQQYDLEACKVGARTALERLAKCARQTGDLEARFDRWILQDTLREIPGAWLLNESSSRILNRNGLPQHAARMLRHDPPPIDAMVDTVAEFSIVYSALDHLRYVWRPSDTAGPQLGEWKMHAELHKRLARISRGVLKEQRR